jgi:hypothetical protein
MRARVRNGVVGATLALVVIGSAGCGPAATSSASSEPSSAAPSTAPSATAAPTTSPSASVAVLGEGFPIGAIPAGTWTATLMKPAFSLTLPDGWSRGTADREVLVLEQGDVTVGFHHRVPKVEAAALGDGATATTVGPYQGFTMTSDGPMHLWYTDGQQEISAPAGTKIQSWVIALGADAVTVDLAAPAAGFDAAVDAFLPILATLTAPS